MGKIVCMEPKPPLKFRGVAWPSPSTHILKIKVSKIISLNPTHPPPPPPLIAVLIDQIKSRGHVWGGVGVLSPQI